MSNTNQLKNGRYSTEKKKKKKERKTTPPTHFTGDEEYQADGSSIKKAQHSAAQLALASTAYKHPPEKCEKPITSRRNITPTVELNALAMKRGEVTEYAFLEQPAHAQSVEGYHHARFRGTGRGEK